MLKSLPMKGTGMTSLLFDTTRSDNPVSSSTAGDPAPGNQKQVFDFLTIQSLTFPAASAAVAGGWAVLQKAFGSWADGNEIALVIAYVIIAASVATNWSSLTNSAGRIGAILIGLVNGLLLSAGALGVAAVVTNTSVLG